MALQNSRGGKVSVRKCVYRPIMFDLLYANGEKQALFGEKKQSEMGQIIGP